ncbi:MAG: TRAP transporter TatT component family protein [Deltaproteobacteria bacterium]|nr:TRAP transporter TatT component family protein [Deltaproteobacteria bacterium]
MNLDNPAALGELSMAQKCLKRVMEMDPEFFYGSPYIVYGSMLAARPKILGGDADRAKVFFEKAMALTQGKFFLAPYYYAKTYAVRVQNKALFLQLIEAVETTPPDDIKAACLMNRVMKERMKTLKAEAEDLFFECE